MKFLILIAAVSSIVIGHFSVMGLSWLLRHVLSPRKSALLALILYMTIASVLSMSLLKEGVGCLLCWIFIPAFFTAIGEASNDGLTKELAKVKTALNYMQLPSISSYLGLPLADLKAGILHEPLRSKVFQPRKSQQELVTELLKLINEASPEGSLFIAILISRINERTGINALEMALKKGGSKPFRRRALARLGSIYLSMGKGKKATQCYEEAMTK